MIKGVGFAEFTDNFTGGFAGRVFGNGGKLFGKGVGNIFRSSEVVWLIWGERNGLVWRDGFLFAGKGFEHGPEFSGICFRRGVGESFSPFFFSIFGANGLDLLVKKLDLWRGRVLLADMVSLFHEGGGFRRDVGDVIFSVARGDGMFGSSQKDFTENKFSSGAGRGFWKVSKLVFSFLLEKIPVCSPETKEGFKSAWGFGVRVREGNYNWDMI